MIKQCKFGSMDIGHTTYQSDLIIYPDGRVVDNWRRLTGHHLSLEDLQALLAAKPDMIIAGTGVFGRMRVDSKVVEALSDRNIELIALHTKPAAQEFNRRLEEKRKVAGCFHLTC